MFGSLPHAASAPLWAWTWSPGGPAGNVPSKRRDLPRSWAAPLHLCPVLRPRRDLHARPLRRAGTVSADRKTKTPLNSFRGSFTRRWCWLSTLRRMGHPTTTQDSLPAVGQLYRVGLVTYWAATKGFGSCLPLHRLPPFPSFVAQPVCNSCNSAEYRVSAIPSGTTHTSGSGSDQSLSTIGPWRRTQ